MALIIGSKRSAVEIHIGRNCGSVTSTSVNPVDAAEALGLGYAVVNTDTGHEQDPATILLTWAVSDSTPPVVNTPAIIDFFYRAVHQVTVATKQYVEAYYSGPIDYAYFDGCSTGGRQSMVEGTRYPVDYDGLIVGDSAIAYHNGRLSTLKQGLAFVPTGTYIPPAVVAQVDAAVMASCDPLDGVVDGLIKNPAACNILPSALAAQGILTTAQANALQAYILPETVTSGPPLFPGMPISELSTANFIMPGTNDEITTAPPFPTVNELGRGRTRCLPGSPRGPWNRLAANFAEGHIACANDHEAVVDHIKGTARLLKLEAS